MKGVNSCVAMDMQALSCDICVTRQEVLDEIILRSSV